MGWGERLLEDRMPWAGAGPFGISCSDSGEWVYEGECARDCGDPQKMLQQIVANPPANQPAPRIGVLQAWTFPDCATHHDPGAATLCTPACAGPVFAPPTQADAPTATCGADGTWAFTGTCIMMGNYRMDDVWADERQCDRQSGRPSCQDLTPANFAAFSTEQQQAQCMQACQSHPHEAGCCELNTRDDNGQDANAPWCQYCPERQAEIRSQFQGPEFYFVTLSLFREFKQASWVCGWVGGWVCSTPSALDPARTRSAPSTFHAPPLSPKNPSTRVPPLFSSDLQQCLLL